MIAAIKSSIRKHQYLLINELADCIESYWKEYLDLSSYEIPDGLGYVEGSLEGERLIIENHCYQTSQFRKLHLELARVGNSLDILHCVMFPHTNFPLPIFGVDIVASKAGVGAAIVDLSPMSSGGVLPTTMDNRTLPQSYQEKLTNLPKLEFSQPRDLPEWGNIFSDFCLFIRPVNRHEESLFLQQVQHFLRLHCQTAVSTPPLSSQAEIAEVFAAQKYYCTQQQKNDKTRKVLEKSLGEAWTEKYIKNMLFDIPSI